MKRAYPIVVIVVVGLVGCGSSEGDDLLSGGGSADAAVDVGEAGDASVPVTPEVACSELASAYCGSLTRCASFFGEIIFGGTAKCVEVARSSCARTLAAPDTGATPDGLVACAAAVEASSCDATLSRETPAACRPTGGARNLGGGCLDDWQCASGRCQPLAGVACGVCVERIAEGAACQGDDDCDFGLSCPEELRRCVRRGGAGESCATATPCKVGFSCVGAVGAAVCRPAAEAGDSCESPATQVADCDIASGIYCGAGGSCRKIGRAAPGERCGVVGATYTICVGGGRCSADSGQGVCRGPVGAGEACTATSSGAPCEPGLRCVAGTCVAPSIAACP